VIDAEHTRLRLAMDAAIALALGTFGFASGLNSSDLPANGVGVASVLGAAGGVLLFRRTRPMVSFTVSMGLLSLVALLYGHYESGVTALIALVATYSAAKYGVSLPFVAVTLVAFSAILNLGQPFEESVGDLFFTLPFLGAAGAAGVLARRLGARAAAEAELRERAEVDAASAASTAVAEERARVARELHDILAHSLGVVVLQTGAAEYAWEQDPSSARRSLIAARTTALEAIEQLRTLLEVVRDNPSDDRSPLPALTDIAALAARASHAGFQVEMHTRGTPRDVSPQVQASVYRVAQEGISNALKHSGARGCDVHLTYLSNEVRIEVTDTGDGASDCAGSRLGLVGIRERAALVGARVTAGPLEPVGWQLAVDFPA
jgi:signal transduction histidine kinase